MVNPSKDESLMSSHITCNKVVIEPQHIQKDTSWKSKQEPVLLDNIIVGYAFGPKKMETMGLIMAEASKALSTVITPTIAYSEEVSVLTAGETDCSMADRERHYFPDDCDDEDARSFSSTRASSITSHSLRGCGGGIQLTFFPGDFIPIGRTCGEEDQSVDSSMVTAATTMATGMSSIRSTPGKQKLVDDSCGKISTLSSQLSLRRCASTNGMRTHPIRVSFVPIDLDTPLEEQHGGKFDVILHKMTEDILCISKMLRSRQKNQGCDLICKGDLIDEAIELLDSSDANSKSDNRMMAETSCNRVLSRHEERAARRIQRLREYNEKSHPSCVLVDSPINILAVMSRSDMAEVLSSCLKGLKTKGGIPVSTPRFRVVEEGGESAIDSDLADEIDATGFCYPLIAKPLTAAGTKSSHHMGIVMARDGLKRLKTPCLLQEFCNHGGYLFKVYVLGESVWVFSRESLPNLPPGESELFCIEKTEEHRRSKSYVEFERPAGSRNYVEFNSQRPYPTLSDFGVAWDEVDMKLSTNRNYSISEQGEPKCKRRRVCTTSPNDRSLNTVNNPVSTLAGYVTKEEIEPVTNALHSAFGLDLFGFDILLKHESKEHQCESNVNVKEILVVDVNYFPGYKEVPHFPSLLAQYLTQKAVETRVCVMATCNR